MEFVEFMKEKKRITNKCSTFCEKCKFSTTLNGKKVGCYELILEYPEDAEHILKEWIEEDRRNIDWSKVKVDTLIEVWGNMGWVNRYFSRYVDGTVYAWKNGATSKTTNYDVMCSKARLVKEDK